MKYGKTLLAAALLYLCSFAVGYTACGVGVGNAAYAAGGEGAGFAASGQQGAGGVGVAGLADGASGGGTSGFAGGAGSERAVNAELRGFFLGAFSGRTTGRSLAARGGGDFLLGEERIRLDIDAWASSIEASARIRGDFIHDSVADEFRIDVREAYIDYTAGGFDLRLGRQIATWGVGDLLFINDVFPKDWESFFSGRPLEYLKVGVDGFRTRYSSSALNAELLVIPFFTPDEILGTDRFLLFDPFPSEWMRDERLPDNTYENVELALRLYRRIAGLDVSLYGYSGFWRTPGMEVDRSISPVRVMAFYPALSVFGLSAQGSAPGGIASFESGYYHSRDDDEGIDPTVPNSQVRFLVGYQRQLIEDLDLGIQYYGEVMEKHAAYLSALPAGLPAEKEYRDYVTLRLDHRMKHRTLKLGLFAFYGHAERDYLLQPELAYKFSDDLSATLGGNIFGGEKNTTFLGQLDGNDNVFLWARFDF